MLDIEVFYLLLSEWPVGDTETGSFEVNDRNNVLEFIEVFDFSILLTVVVKARIAHQLYECFILYDGRS